MSDERFERLRQLFTRALDLPEHERDAFVERECGDDAMRSELLAMLDAEKQSGDFMRGSAAAWVGKRIDNYSIREVVAEGGMGIVLRARQEQPNRDVAIKVIRPEAISENALRRFELESEVLGRLAHPGIAQIFDAATVEVGSRRHPYFVMEMIEGAPLTDYAEEGRVGRGERIQLMIQVCEAVHHAHQQGVIHRDLKPSNIIVREDGQPKVLDFGVARVTDSDLQVTTVNTDVGQVIGTMPYMSPEQVRGRHEELDTRSDIYALGVVCYELLTGRLPHEVKGRSLPEAARIISDEEPRALGATGESFPADLETIVGKCLAKERGERYASAHELADDLRRFLRNEPIAARPPSAIYQLRKFARRNRGVVGASGIAVVAMLVGLGISIAGWSRAHQQEKLTAIEADKSSALNQFLVNMLAAPDPFNSGADVRVVDVLDRAAADVDSTLAGRPEVAASVHRALGETYRGLGLEDKAEVHIIRTLSLMSDVVDVGQDPKALVDLFNLGNLYLDQDRMVEADSIGRVIEQVMEATDANTAPYASACLFLGWLDEAHDRYEEAAARLRPCLETARSALGPEHTRSLDIAMALGNIEWQAGHPEEARDLMEGALEVMERQNGPDHPAVLSLVNNLAFVYREVGDNDQSLVAFERALDAKLRIYGDDHFSTAVGYHNLGHQLRMMGRPDEAIPNHEKALAIARRIFEPDDIRIQILSAGYGQALLAAKRTREAETVLKTAYERFGTELGADHRRSRSVAGMLASAYAELGDTASAARYQALAGDEGQ